MKAVDPHQEYICTRTSCSEINQVAPPPRSPLDAGFSSQKRELNEKKNEGKIGAGGAGEGSKQIGSME